MCQTYHEPGKEFGSAGSAHLEPQDFLHALEVATARLDSTKLVDHVPHGQSLEVCTHLFGRFPLSCISLCMALASSTLRNQPNRFKPPLPQRQPQILSEIVRPYEQTLGCHACVIKDAAADDAAG